MTYLSEEEIHEFQRCEDILTGHVGHVDDGYVSDDLDEARFRLHNALATLTRMPPGDMVHCAHCGQPISEVLMGCSNLYADDFDIRVPIHASDGGCWLEVPQRAQVWEDIMPENTGYDNQCRADASELAGDDSHMPEIQCPSCRGFPFKGEVRFGMIRNDIIFDPSVTEGIGE